MHRTKSVLPVLSTSVVCLLEPSPLGSCLIASGGRKFISQVTPRQNNDLKVSCSWGSVTAAQFLLRAWYAAVNRVLWFCLFVCFGIPIYLCCRSWDKELIFHCSVTTWISVRCSGFVSRTIKGFHSCNIVLMRSLQVAISIFHSFVTAFLHVYNLLGIRCSFYPLSAWFNFYVFVVLILFWSS